MVINSFIFFFVIISLTGQEFNGTIKISTGQPFVRQIDNKYFVPIHEINYYRHLNPDNDILVPVEIKAHKERLLCYLPLNMLHGKETYATLKIILTLRNEIWNLKFDVTPLFLQYMHKAFLRSEKNCTIL